MISAPPGCEVASNRRTRSTKTSQKPEPSLQQTLSPHKTASPPQKVPHHRRPARRTPKPSPPSPPLSALQENTLNGVEEARSPRWRKDPGTSRDRDEGHRPGERADPAGCRHRVLSGPAIPRPARASHGPWPPTPSPHTATEQVRIGAPLGQEPLPYPRKTSVRASPVTCGVTCRSKAHGFRPEAGQSR